MKQNLNDDEALSNIYRTYDCMFIVIISFESNEYDESTSYKIHTDNINWTVFSPDIYNVYII